MLQPQPQQPTTTESTNPFDDDSEDENNPFGSEEKMPHNRQFIVTAEISPPSQVKSPKPRNNPENAEPFELNLNLAPPPPR